MAGAGYKLFNTGDVLTAAQVNTYLMQQTVMVFADSSARTTALSGVLAEGMISYLKDTNAVEVYDGSSWVASDDPNAIQNSIVDAKGDLITATADNTPARIASSGVNGDILTVDTSTATGLKWAAPAGGGGYTLLSTTSMSGSSSVTVSSINGTYKHLYIISQGAYQATSSSALTYTLNGSTACLQWRLSMSNTTLTTGGTYEPTAFDIGTLYSSSAKPLSLEIFIPRYADTSIKKFHYVRTHTSSGGTWSAVWGNNAIDSTSAVTSFTISAGANFAGGTIWIYGVN